MSTLTKQQQDARTVRNGGRTHEGRPLRKGDVLYDRRSGVSYEFVGMTQDGRVKVKHDGQTKTIARSSFGANLTFSRPTYW